MKATVVILLAVLFLGGCGATAASSASSTQAGRPAMSGTCSLQHRTQPYDPHTSEYTAPAYTVTLTNTSSVPGNVSDIATVFYGSNGSEETSDQESASGIIAPGQSLSWTFTVPDGLIGPPVQIGHVTTASDGGAYWNDGDPLDVSLVDAQSCQIEKWG